MGRDRRDESEMRNSCLESYHGSRGPPISLKGTSPDLPKASKGHTSFPLSYFSMETMKKLFLILLSLQTLFLVLPFATETFSSFFHLNVMSFH